MNELIEEIKDVLKEGNRVAFVGVHDIVRVGDVGVVERVLTDEEKRGCQQAWESNKDYKYQVCFNGTVLVVSEEDIVSLPIGQLLQL